ncbi:tRNA-dihydrouridine(20) synthase [NAD(P)+]-like protein [Tanacetum coccineum]|uniref:tRNA-dihydrouridine(20) synthase [NAD(P)+]-like protein n=1 Tax=Tanacetum coccineum TaxID=301880 RepID=A0ABQ5CN39_9ASTR
MHGNAAGMSYDVSETRGNGKRGETSGERPQEKGKRFYNYDAAFDLEKEIRMQVRGRGMEIEEEEDEYFRVAHYLHTSRGIPLTSVCQKSKLCQPIQWLPQKKKIMEYRNKLVLAPMVRVGTLPFRLLAAQYGSDITYGEEIIDHKLLKCERRINDVIGCTDIVEKGTENVVFRTCDEERNRLNLQAYIAGCKDVAAIDVNMGCPKAFSISGGMGAALLTKPDLIHDILTTLKRNLCIPVTCKIRLLNSTHDTVELARRIEKTGVSAVGVHGRRVADRPRDPANWTEIATVVDALSIPVIANGDVFQHDDFQRVRTVTGASSVMVARGALWNASVFHPQGTPIEVVKREYVRKSILWDHDIKSTKYTLKEMIMHYTSLELPEGKAVTKSESLADIARLYGEEKYYESINTKRHRVLLDHSIL